MKPRNCGFVTCEQWDTSPGCSPDSHQNPEVRLFVVDGCPILVEPPPTGRSRALDPVKGPGKGCLVIKTRSQCDLYERLIAMGEQVFGMIDPKLDQKLVNGRPKTMTEAAGEVTCRKRARECQFVDGDISLETCPQHLLGTQLLPRIETLLWNARE